MRTLYEAVLAAAATAVMLMGHGSAAAAPVASGPALAGPGDGLNSHWVRSEFIAHSVAEAVDILATTDPSAGFIESVSFIAPYVDYRDFEPGTGGLFDSPDLPDPYTEQSGGAPISDVPFAVRFSGYLNVIADGSYEFQVHSDDGFRLTVGGEVIAIFDGDRSPESSFSAPIDLTSGLYAIELIGWEQGGLYVDELSWLTPGATDYAVIGTDAGGRALFSVVPVPAALPLLASALAGLGWARGRRR